MQNVLELGVESLHAFISVQRNVRCMHLEVSSQNRRERAFVEYKGKCSISRVRYCLRVKAPDPISRFMGVKWT